jgi:phosphomethylpyrimidine synthase
MNKHVADLAAPEVTTGPLPASRKIYATPDGAPDLRVPLREIGLSEGSGEAPLPVYDTSGPYTDPAVSIEVTQGLARTREAWVRERGGVESYAGREVKPEDNGNAGTRLERAFERRHAPLRGTGEKSRT